MNPDETQQKSLANEFKKEREENIKRSETILGSIGEGIIVLNKKLKVTTINAAALHMFHKQRSSCVGKSYKTFLRVVDKEGKKTPDEIHKFLKKAFKINTTSKIKSLNISRAFIKIPRMGVLPISLNIAALQSEYGTVYGGVITIRDASDEAEVENLKTEFVSIASHQLAAPLTSIRWNIEMLLNGDVGPVASEQRPILTDVLDSNTRMIRLVNDLLNVSRLEEGRINIDPQSINVKILVQDILNEYNHFISSRGMKVRVVSNKSDTDHIVSADPVIIRQIINNLIVNAVQYSSKASAQMVITLEPRGIDYQVSVWDNGIGIPKDVQKKIFTKFFRADNAQEREAIGTGLGLYITKMLVELMGGKIWFKSDPKSGTTFFLTMPAHSSKKNRGGKKLIT